MDQNSKRADKEQDRFDHDDTTFNAKRDHLNRKGAKFAKEDKKEWNRRERRVAQREEYQNSNSAILCALCDSKCLSFRLCDLCVFAAQLSSFSVLRRVRRVVVVEIRR
ncbi:MAG: hypothetical protein JSS27_01375 [Planctomycetes bacterium]|nr:hypothetical protein [Planctomycetota bacterium]